MSHHLLYAIALEAIYQTYLVELRAHGRTRMPSRRRYMIDYSIARGSMPEGFAQALLSEDS